MQLSHALNRSQALADPHKIRMVAMWFLTVLGAHVCCEIHFCTTSAEMADIGIAAKYGKSRFRCARSLD